ncbi:MAG: hypothetical protein AAGI30_05180 [Planctomycetota bacterium]
MTRWWVLVLAASLLPGGCREAGTGQGSSGAAVSRIDEQVGPIRAARLSVTPPAGTAADAFSVHLRVVLSAGAEAVEPEGESGWGQAIELPAEWRLIGEGFASSTEAVADGTVVVVVADAAPLAGSYEVGPATVVARDEAGVETTLSLPPVAVEVRSVLPEGHTGAWDPEQGELGAPVRLPWWWIAGGVLVLGAVIASAAVAVRVLMKRASQPKRVLPHTVAIEELRALEATFAIAQDWSVPIARLSEIARAYVEHRYDIHAPERTTEEFLREASSTGHIGEDDREQLGAFLNRCDLVKFARHQAQGDEVRSAAGDIRAFVDRSATERVALLVDRRGRIVGREERGA